MAGGLGSVSINRDNTRKTAALEKFQPNIANNISKRTVLLDFLKERTKIYDGGAEVAVRFRYTRSGKLGQNTHVNAFNYYDKLTTQPTDTVKVGSEAWSNIQNPITISHEEQIENRGNKEFDLVKSNTEFTMDDTAEDMNDVFWGVAGGSQAKLPTPLTTYVSGANAGTICNLSKASNTWLYSQYTASIGDAATNLLDKMTTGYNSCVDNSPNKSVDKPTAALMDQSTFEVLQGIYPSYLNLTSTKDADIGFPTINYMGMKLRFDSTCPLDSSSNHQCFILTPKYWELAIDKTWNYHTTKFYDMLPDQAADVAQLIVRVALICNNCRTNWWGYGITL